MSETRHETNDCEENDTQHWWEHQSSIDIEPSVDKVETYIHYYCRGCTLNRYVKFKTVTTYDDGSLRTVYHDGQRKTTKLYTSVPSQ